MSSTRKLLTMGVLATVVASGTAAYLALGAQAHGAASSPGSRTYLCFQDAHWTGGDLDARNAACADAIAAGGKQPLWDWYGVGNSATAGRTRGFIPDGKLCSGNNPTYAAYDAARDDWPTTHLTSGADWAFKYPTIDGHPGSFYLYVTKDGYDPTKPLTWDSLEDKPFSTATFAALNGPGEYDWDIKLPAGKTGHHVIYAYWQRSDHPGAFFGCSDVVFDGGNGEISGYPNTNQPAVTPTVIPPSPTAAPTVIPPSPIAAPTVTPPAPTTTFDPNVPSFKETFEDGRSDEWFGSGGSWAVVKAPWTIANVYFQSDTTSSSAKRFTGDVAWKNYTVEAHLRPGECSRATCYAAILARASSSSSFARVVLIPGTGTQLQFVTKGRVRVVGTLANDIALHGWHIVRITVSGSEVSATIDGTFIAKGSGGPATGRIGLMTSYASSGFDNIVVTPGG
jgi:predicted carbohydrate-binding protein with CBM5 and CBM33 domain